VESVYVNFSETFLELIVKSSSRDMILYPFLSTIGVIVPLAFTMITQSPAEGVAGNVIFTAALRTYVIDLTAEVLVDTTWIPSVMTGVMSVLLVRVSVPASVTEVCVPRIDENVAIVIPP
jgi:hypothetical protein